MWRPYLAEIFDLPGSVVTDDNDHPVQLENLDWQAFGIGDKIWLRLEKVRTDPNGQERVLLRWSHGVQNAFGPRGAVLPSCHIDKAEGSVTYGAGQIQIVVPTGYPHLLPTTAIIGDRGYLTSAICTPNNSSENISGKKLWRWLRYLTNAIRPPNNSSENIGGKELWHWLHGRTVLVVPDGSGGVTVAGFAGCIATPAEIYVDGAQIEWNNDLLFFDTFRFDQANTPVSNSKKLADLLDAAGGSIAVTVEDTEASHSGGLKIVRFSRRHQHVRTGGLARAVPTGITTSQDFVLLRIGGRQIKIAAEQFVNGAPEALRVRIIEEVNRLGTAVWVHVKGSRVHLGVPVDQDDHTDVTQVRVVAIVNSGNDPVAGNSLIAGLVCENVVDKRFHWLPIEELCATLITRAQAEVIFLGDVPPLDVHETETGTVSVIQHWRTKDEISHLRPSAHLVVRRVAEIGCALSAARETPQTASATPVDDLWIARSAATNLLMTLRANGAVADGEAYGLVAVEVARRWHEGGMVRIETIPRGTAVARIDLPSEFIMPSKTASERGIPERITIVEADRTFDYVDRLNALPNLDCYGLLTALESSIPFLNVNSDARPDAVSLSLWRLLADLYLRGLRSFHIEPIARRHALRRRGTRAEDENLAVAKQIDEIFNIARKPGARDLTDSIERLILFANLYPLTRNSMELVHAVAAAFGASYDLRKIRPNDGVIARLVTATRPFLLARETFTPVEVKRLEDAAHTCFEDLRYHLLSNNVDIPLLRGVSIGEP